jgi:hypothetical protein
MWPAQNIQSATKTYICPYDDLQEHYSSHHTRVSDKDNPPAASLPKERRPHLGESIKLECPEITGPIRNQTYFEALKNQRYVRLIPEFALRV